MIRCHMPEGHCDENLRTHTFVTRRIVTWSNAFYCCNETDANSSIDFITARVLEGFLTVYSDVSNRKLQLVKDRFRVHVFLDWILPTFRERDAFLAPQKKYVRLVLRAETSSWRYRSRLRLKCDGTLAQKPDFVFRRNGRVHLNRRGVSSVDYWQASCTHQPAGFVLLVQACVLQSCDAYWLPTPFSCFPFISPPVRHRVPSHFNWTLLRLQEETIVMVCNTLALSWSKCRAAKKRQPQKCSCCWF
jgi:hypothetical protein